MLSWGATSLWYIFHLFHLGTYLHMTFIPINLWQVKFFFFLMMHEKQGWKWLVQSYPPFHKEYHPPSDVWMTSITKWVLPRKGRLSWAMEYLPDPYLIALPLLPGEPRSMRLMNTVHCLGFSHPSVIYGYTKHGPSLKNLLTDAVGMKLYSLKHLVSCKLDLIKNVNCASL